MPEGPEVTFLTEFINKKLHNNILKSVEFLNGFGCFNERMA